MNDQPPAPGPPPLPGGTPPERGQPDSPAADAPLSRLPEAVETECSACGSQLEYRPNSRKLSCLTCGAEREFTLHERTLEEHGLTEWQSVNQHMVAARIAAHELQCTNCGAITETNDLATVCQFCDSPLIALASPEGLIVPEGVVPFGLSRAKAMEMFAHWVDSRRFAPNALKKVGSTEGLSGVYVPHWTFDAKTVTEYRGERGKHYYVEEGDRRRRKTDWTPVAGRLNRFFDDVVVLASHTLDPSKVERMGPWNLRRAKPFQNEFLAGYSALRYEVDPHQGSEIARSTMAEQIRQDIREDIGGDDQRITTMNVEYLSATFKLLLLPLWIASYTYDGKTWQVMVNANNGEVVGDRPYSRAKLAALAAGVVAVLVLLLYLFIR